MPKKKCPDCKGSGKYVGLNVIEPCILCEGKGRIEVEEMSLKKRRKIKKSLAKVQKEDDTKSPPRPQPGLPQVQLSFDFDDESDYDTDEDALWDQMYPFTLD